MQKFDAPFAHFADGEYNIMGCYRNMLASGTFKKFDKFLDL
jgi:hypothetical protein